ncbi:hypothetical protein BpHYR1_008443 [Brachionus plicatilis]|uniref:Uncharacterized protein n=1 Tax=Brachionus plicatilis TaxID=10195 RepID=A0A3M7PTV4_BRAPC|nr:hypothetical protein BpHYR1_008443 [Brachionus plicatilis]
MPYQNENGFLNNSKYANISQKPSPRDAENIHEIRRLIQEQSNVMPAKQRTKSNPNPNLDLDLPFKRFSTLPDIPSSDDPFYRTESNLKNDKIDNQEKQIGDQNSKNEEKKSQIINIVSRKDTFYHFASSSTSRITIDQKFSSFENQSTLRNALDLDEDLPISNEPKIINQRLIFTCPVSRMISPIKRPQAPSPPTSAIRKRSFQNSESDSETYPTFRIYRHPGRNLSLFADFLFSLISKDILFELKRYFELIINFKIFYIKTKNQNQNKNKVKKVKLKLDILKYDEACKMLKLQENKTKKEIQSQIKVKVRFYPKKDSKSKLGSTQKRISWYRKDTLYELKWYTNYFILTLRSNVFKTNLVDQEKIIIHRNVCTDLKLLQFKTIYKLPVFNIYALKAKYSFKLKEKNKFFFKKSHLSLTPVIAKKLQFITKLSKDQKMTLFRKKKENIKYFYQCSPSDASCDFYSYLIYQNDLISIYMADHEHQHSMKNIIIFVYSGVPDLINLLIMFEIFQILPS